jgi:hypothetical protein
VTGGEYLAIACEGTVTTGTGLPDSQHERGDMAQNQWQGEHSPASEKRMRRIDIGLAVAASLLSVGLFYLALFPQ